MMSLQQKAKFGDVREISAIDYVQQVNKAGEGIWVVLHLHKSGYPFQMIFVTSGNCFSSVQQFFH